MRLFIAVWPPPQVLEGVTLLQGRLREMVPGVAWVPVPAMHVTLKFIGEASSEQLDQLMDNLEAVASESKEFTLTLSKLGAFPKLGSPRVPFLGISGDIDRLGRLAERLSDACAHVCGIDEQAFRPHLTLGRVRNRADETALAAAMSATPFTGLPEWKVDSFDLVESTLSRSGPSYRIVRRFHLGSAVT